ncbi:MAG: hypothetical protein FWB90_04620 [Fibromonadales bacterium]|nr:hypothetical protein [Fibromonadales bacterium]
MAERDEVAEEHRRQEQILRMKEKYAKTDAERKDIAIALTDLKYAEELRLAEEYEIATSNMRRRIIETQEAEIKAIKIAAWEQEWQLREDAAKDEEERINIQMERARARYEMEARTAGENIEYLDEIYRASEAERERLEWQLVQVRAKAAEYYLNLSSEVANGIVGIGQALGYKMKEMAIAEALINIALGITKAIASFPFPAFLGPMAKAIAVGAQQIATISRAKFATGGIVGGNSFSGDQVPIRVNSGEMILNKEQQKTLLNIANGSEQQDNRQPINITFAPNISPGINSEDVKKMLRENQSLFRSFMANEVSRGLSSAGVFA